MIPLAGFNRLLLISILIGHALKTEGNLSLFNLEHKQGPILSFESIMVPIPCFWIWCIQLRTERNQIHIGTRRCSDCKVKYWTSVSCWQTANMLASGEHANACQSCEIFSLYCDMLFTPPWNVIIKNYINSFNKELFNRRKTRFLTTNFFKLVADGQHQGGYAMYCCHWFLSTVNFPSRLWGGFKLQQSQVEVE